MRDNNSVRVPRSLRDLAYKALQEKEKFAFSFGREPTVEEIACRLQADPKNVVAALDAISEPVSLYEPVYSDSTDSVFILDQIKDLTNTDEEWVNTIALSQAIDKLDQREKRILAMRFFRGCTQTEVAEEIGISQAQVSRIEKNALEKVRNRL